MAERSTAVPALILAILFTCTPAQAQVSARAVKPEAEAARLNALAEQAYALNLADDHQRAEPALREVVLGWRGLGWGDTEATRGTVLLWAWSLVELGRFDEAEAELTAIVDEPSATGAQLTSAWGLLAKSYSRMGRFLDSERAAVAALDQARRAYGEAHPETATAWHNLGTAHGEAGRVGDAVAALRHAVALREQLFGPTGEPTLASIYNLAAHLHARGDPAQAESLLREILIHAEPGGESHVHALHHLGYTLSHMGRHAEAEPWLRLAVEQRAARPDRHQEAVSLSALADALRGQGRHAEAEAAYDRAIEMIDGERHPGRAMTLSAVLLGLGENRQAAGNAEAAEEAYRQAVGIARANLVAGHPRRTLREMSLAAFLNDAGRPGEALALLRPARDALLARTRALEGGGGRDELAPFRSLFRETVQAAWSAAQPEAAAGR